MFRTKYQILSSNILLTQLPMFQNLTRFHNTKSVFSMTERQLSNNLELHKYRSYNTIYCPHCYLTLIVNIVIIKRELSCWYSSHCLILPLNVRLVHPTAKIINELLTQGLCFLKFSLLMANK